MLYTLEQSQQIGTQIIRKRAEELRQDNNLIIEQELYIDQEIKEGLDEIEKGLYFEFNSEYRKDLMKRVSDKLSINFNNGI